MGRRTAFALLGSAALLLSTLFAAPARAVDHVTYYIGHVDEALDYDEGSACAATTYWTDGEFAYDSDDDVVRDVVALATDGDTIHLCAGTWEFATYVDAQGVDLYWDGAGIGETILDGGATYDVDGDLTADGTEMIVFSEILRISDMTIRNGGGGDDGSYGALYGGDVVVDGVEFYRNTSDGDGGAIWASGDAQVVDSTFTENRANGMGGAIAALTLTVRDSSFASNVALLGAGGAVITGDDVISIDTDYHANIAYTEDLDLVGGGAIATSGPITVRGGTFTENVAGVGGGALLNLGEDEIVISGATFEENTSILIGGAVLSTGEVTISESFFRENASASGGAVWSAAGMSGRNNRFTSNVATGLTFDLLFGESCIGGGGAIFTIGDVTSTGSAYTSNASDIPEELDFASCDSWFSGGTLIGTGGGIAANGAVISTGDSFVSNRAAIFGGGAASFIGFLDMEETSGVSALTRTRFVGNIAGSATIEGWEEYMTTGGGGYMQIGGGIVVEGSSFVRNVTGNIGGGLVYQAYEADVPLRMTRNTFSDNSAGDASIGSPTTWVGGGGAAIFYPETLQGGREIVRNTFRNNVTTGIGGGLFITLPTAAGFARNSVIGNRAARGGGIALEVCTGNTRRLVASFKATNQIGRNRANVDRDISVDDTLGYCAPPG
jgi:predicted outer membrane repeat protein